MRPKVEIGEETCQFTIVAARITFLQVIFEFNQIQAGSAGRKKSQDGLRQLKLFYCCAGRAEWSDLWLVE